MKLLYECSPREELVCKSGAYCVLLIPVWRRNCHLVSKNFRYTSDCCLHLSPHFWALKSHVYEPFYSSFLLSLMWPQVPISYIATSAALFHSNFWLILSFHFAHTHFCHLYISLWHHPAAVRCEHCRVRNYTHSAGPKMIPPNWNFLLFGLNLSIPLSPLVTAILLPSMVWQF